MLAQLQQRLSSHTPRVFNSHLPKAAVLIPVTNDPEPALIFTRRASHMNIHRGEVAFPGGKEDDTDTSLINTALRESEEEIGLDPEQVQILGMTGNVISRFGLEVTPVVGIVEADAGLTPNTEELDRIFRVPLSFFLVQSNLQYDQLNHNGKDYAIPCFQYQEYRIWGLTAMMLAEFLNVTLDANIEMDSPDLSRYFASQFNLA